ncbi:RICIN domain-containing protein [Streptomyces sp. NPDC026206]|uniref:RICIN domain-containing protein n=1 Tax=Streptomyces sp. NPDC026206 TaxID=3157089 RepID=UPI0033E61D4F
MFETKRSGDVRSRVRAKTVLRKKTRPGLLTAGILMSTVLGATQAGAATTLAATTEAPPSPDACVGGTKWRLTTPNDHVCIGASRQSDIGLENYFSNFYRDPATGRCKSGFVARNAVPGDNVCVAPHARDNARGDAERAPSNWVATADRNNWWNPVPHPFLHPESNYLMQSADTRERDGRHVLVADVFRGSTDNAAKLIVWVRTGGDNQRFQFRAPRTSNGGVFQNKFEIVAKNSGKCLDVQGFGTHDGARIIQWPCHGGSNQLWYLERRADNTWQIRSYHSHKCLDAHNPALTAPSQGTHLQQWSCIGGKNQSWRLLSTG